MYILGDDGIGGCQKKSLHENVSLTLNVHWESTNTTALSMVMKRDNLLLI